MMKMSRDAADQLSAMSSDKGSCCQVSSSSPAKSQAIVTSESKNLSRGQAPVSALDGPPTVTHAVRNPGTAPPLFIAPAQALLCTFLI